MVLILIRPLRFLFLVLAAVVVVVVAVAAVVVVVVVDVSQEDDEEDEAVVFPELGPEYLMTGKPQNMFNNLNFSSSSKAFASSLSFFKKKLKNEEKTKTCLTFFFR